MSVRAKRLDRLERVGRSAGRLVVIECAASMSDDEAVRRLNFTVLASDTVIFLQRFAPKAGLPKLISVRG